MTMAYRIYKDRFFLSLSVSIFVHILVLFFFYLLPNPEKHVALRPISVGVLQSQNKSIESFMKQEQQSQSSSQARPTKSHNIPTQTPQIKHNPQQAIPKPQSTLQTAPSTDIDLQSLNIPQEDIRFDPLATMRQPSLTQSLQQEADNKKLNNLPHRIQSELQKLYGTELNNMSKEQKDYLAESYFINGEVFQQTADRMGYPKLAMYLKQQGKGIIEFRLHPDGHIDAIRIITSTGFEALDDSMREVVELSAKNLKRPPQPVIVRLGGNYRITNDGF